MRRRYVLATSVAALATVSIGIGRSTTTSEPHSPIWPTTTTAMTPVVATTSTQQSVVVVSAISTEHPTPQVAEFRCEEDQGCWDCSTMGNRICGVER